MNTMTNISTTSISSSAVLFDLHMGNYSAKKTDKEVGKKIEAENNVKGAKKVGEYKKNLLVDNKQLEEIGKFIAKVRNWNNSHSMPWNDNGLRLLPASFMLEHKTQISEFEIEYWELVELFMSDYQSAISAAAFALGDMFKREEYPSEDVVRSKFSFTYMYSPVPEVGDFRVQVGSIAKAELIEHFEALSNSRVQDALRNVWERMHKVVQHMAERLKESNFDGTREDGKKTKLHGTMITNAQEMVEMLEHLNITKDPNLTDANNSLRRLLMGMDIDELKKDKSAREDTKRKLDDLLSKFDM